jgi:mitogen-activated protein kinase 1/3
MFRSQIHETDGLPPDIRRVSAIQRVLSKKEHRAIYAAVHLPSGESVIIKRISPHGDLAHWRCALREVSFLRHFNHDNIISIRDIKKPRNNDDLIDIYLVQELMETSMRGIIATRKLSEEDCQYLIWQILCAVETMHFAGILHRDLKPSNLLLGQSYRLKVGDLSLARSAIKVADESERVGTLSYRAPEILLAYRNHTKAVDLWSVGCILAEMLGGKQIFPGTGSLLQLKKVFSVLGTPAVEDTLWISPGLIQEIRGLKPRKKVPWKEIFPTASNDILDLLEKLLEFDPVKRINAKEALEHPFLKSYHPSMEESSAAPIPNGLFYFDAETDDLTKEQLKGEIVW